MRNSPGRGKSRTVLAGILLLAALLITAVTGQAALAATAVKVRAGVHKNYARIVFDWPVPVTYTTDLGSDRLSIRFSKPLTAKFGAVRRHLDKFVSGIALSKDGRSVSMKLLRPVRLRDRVIDGVLAFDLVVKPKNSAASKTSGKKPTKKAAKKAGAKSSGNPPKKLSSKR